MFSCDDSVLDGGGGGDKASAYYMEDMDEGGRQASDPMEESKIYVCRYKNFGSQILSFYFIVIFIYLFLLLLRLLDDQYMTATKAIDIASKDHPKTVTIKSNLTMNVFVVNYKTTKPPEMVAYLYRWSTRNEVYNELGNKATKNNISIDEWREMEHAEDLINF